MNRLTQMINDRYDALMFAKSAETARKAARELVRVVLGEEAVDRPLEQALRETCRRLRPSQDPKEQARFEAEFIELGIWPNSAAQPAQTHKIAA
jgi:hypothetical protein